MLGVTEGMELARLPASCIPDLMTFTRIAGDAKDIGPLRSQTLNLARKVFRSDSTIIWLMGQNNRIGDPLELNVQRHLIPQYTNYYYRLNPFDPANIGPFRGSAITMEQVLPFHEFKKTEYYNDFIRPQKLRHQMVVYIRLNNKLTSVICTHRIKDQRFTEDDLAIGDIVSSSMSAAFDRIQMIKVVEKRGSFFQMILDSTDVGLAALDLKRRVLFMNRKAVSICEGIKKNVIPDYTQHRPESVIPPPVLSDCQRLEEWVKNDQGLGFGLDSFPVTERAMAISSFEKCLFRYRIVDKGVTDSNDPFLLITMEVFPSHPRINDHAIKRDCNLTNRETEVVSYIVRGYRNAEIADKLFISEGTVKNHLRNIFEKTNVKNRTGLIHKVLSL
jgi:DNA-binding CsgD family transcriptional regulator